MISSTAAEASAAKRQLRGSGLLLAGRLISLGLNLGTQVILVRALSKASYGAFAYALSIVAILEGVSSLGLDRALERYVPMYDEDGDRSRALGTIALVTGVTVAVGLLLVLAVVGLPGVIAGRFAANESAVTALVILAALGPVQSLDGVLLSLFSTLGQTRAIFLRKFILGPSLKLLAVLVMTERGEGIVFLAVAYLVAGVLGIAIYGTTLVRALREHGLLVPGALRGMRVPARELFGFSLPLLSTDFVFAGMNQADAVMLGQMARPEDVAALRAVLPLARLNVTVLDVFGILYVPLAARLFRRGDHDGVNELYWRTATWVAVLSFPIFAFTFALADPLTQALFGKAYASSGNLLAILALAYYLHAAFGPNGTTLGVHGRVRSLVAVDLLGLVINVGANLVLIPRMGAQGAALATAGALVVHNILKQIAFRSCAGLRAVDPRFAARFVILGAGVAAIALFRASAHRGWLASAAFATAVSFAILVASRRWLDLTDAFPEIGRWRFLRVLLAPGARPG